MSLDSIQSGDQPQHSVSDLRRLCWRAQNAEVALAYIQTHVAKALRCNTESGVSGARAKLATYLRMCPDEIERDNVPLWDLAAAHAALQGGSTLQSVHSVCDQYIHRQDSENGMLRTGDNERTRLEALTLVATFAISRRDSLAASHRGEAWLPNFCADITLDEVGSGTIQVMKMYYAKILNLTIRTNLARSVILGKTRYALFGKEAVESDYAKSQEAILHVIKELRDLYSHLQFGRITKPIVISPSLFFGCLYNEIEADAQSDPPTMPDLISGVMGGGIESCFRDPLDPAIEQAFKVALEYLKEGEGRDHISVFQPLVSHMLPSDVGEKTLQERKDEVK